MFYWNIVDLRYYVSFSCLFYLFIYLFVYFFLPKDGAEKQKYLWKLSSRDPGTQKG